ncbi:MAG: SWIM zinc finger family protein [Thermoguttaceae bacterium]
MYYDYNGFRPYVSVAQKQANARREIAKILKGKKPNPVAPEGKGRSIAKTFWGQAWCENLETYSDFENRMPRGRTYINNGSVVHIEIDTGQVTSYVAGSDLYKIVIKIDPLKPETWRRIKKKCAGEIGSLVELLQGKLSKNVLSIVTDKKDGLFPKPEEIKLDCSCPDWATMCKHVAAALYGVGVLLDKSPELFFKLRGVDHLELIDTSVSIKTGTKDKETLDDSSLQDIFGVELSDSLAPRATKTQTNPKAKKVTKKVPKKKAVTTKAKKVTKSATT